MNNLEKTNELYGSCTNIKDHEQEEKPKTKFQQKFSSFYFPLLTVVPPIYRLTHSDVMCISNNGIYTDYDKNKSGSTSCQLPYEEVLASKHSRKISSRIYSNNANIRSKTCSKSRRGNETPLQHKHLSDSRSRLDIQLHSEHRKYMENLKREREERLVVETRAVIVIQKIMRGFVARRKLYPEGYEVWSKTKERIYSENEIWTRLLEATSRIGIDVDENELLGYSLPEKFIRNTKNNE